jgi:hypothetical protein
MQNPSDIDGPIYNINRQIRIIGLNSNSRSRIFSYDKKLSMTNVSIEAFPTWKDRRGATTHVLDSFIAIMGRRIAKGLRFLLSLCININVFRLTQLSALYKLQQTPTST